METARAPGAVVRLGLLALALVSGLLVIAVPSPASAKVPVSCAGMVNPANATNVTTVRSTPLPGSRTLQLRQGLINGVQYAWSRVTTSRSGDRIWIDISGTSGSTWTQCDLRTLGSTGRNYTNALRTSSSSAVCMRAGIRPAGIGASYVTDPWWC
jgi:hypothetical protein